MAGGHGGPWRGGAVQNRASGAARSAIHPKKPEAEGSRCERADLLKCGSAKGPTAREAGAAAPPGLPWLQRCR